MEVLKCPFCQARVAMIPDTDVFGVVGAVIGFHERNHAAQTPTRSPSGDVCLGVGMSMPLALGVAEDRRAGVHLRAHP